MVSMMGYLKEHRSGQEGTGWEVQTELWHPENTLGDGIISVSHFIVWTLVLAGIENNLGRRIKEKWFELTRQKVTDSQEDLQVDEDV